MITVAEVVARLVKSSPFLEEGFSRGIVNYSALARELRPQVEEALLKEVSEAAILMALKRLAEKIDHKRQICEQVMSEIGELTVRSHLFGYTFQKSDSIVEKQKQLLDAARSRNDPFVTFTQGVFETAIIVGAQLQPTVEEIFCNEKLIARLKDLSAIIIRFPREAVTTPGIHYPILTQLAWRNINVIELISTYTELTIILDRKQVDLAFSILMNTFSP